MHAASDAGARSGTESGTDPPPPPERLRREIEADQVGQLIRACGIGIVLEPLASILLALQLWDHVENERLALWLTLVWGANALRAILWHRYRRQDVNRPILPALKGAFAAGAVIAGGAFGSAVPLLWPEGSLGHQAFVLIGVGGVTGTATITHSGYFPAALAGFASIMSVVAGGLIWYRVEAPSEIVAAGLLFGAGLLVISKHVNGLLRDRFDLRHRLTAAGEASEVANRTKSEFIANMSHELRTPLNAILGFSEILKDQAFGPVGDARYVGYARDIHGSGRHLLDVINDILDISKIELGKMECRDETVDVGQVVGSALNLLKDSAEKNGVAIKSVLPDESPVLRGDERSLKQILLNLLSNAVKFTPLGGDVLVEAKIAPHGDLLLIVRDTGIGMAPEDIPKAMAPFVQVDGSLARKFEGTGLGLPLVKSLVENHGGDFRLTSELSVGTTAIATFPSSRVLSGTANHTAR